MASSSPPNLAGRGDPPASPQNRTYIMIRVAACSILLLGSVLPAQAKDRIVWTDGTVTDKVTVTDFTWREAKWRTRGRTEESKSADLVAALEVEKVKQAYKRAYGADNVDERFAQFQLEAEKRVKDKDLFIAQFGYVEMAKLALSKDNKDQAFAALEELVRLHPDSGFYPELFRMKIDYYLGQGKEQARNAQLVAGKYNQTATTNAWPNGFVRESDYYVLMADALAGKIDGAKLVSGLSSLLRSVEGSYPSIANRVKLQLADAQLQQNDTEGAQKIYEELIDAKGIDESTRAGALVGLGTIHFNAGNAADTEPFRTALMAFLKAYLATDAAPDLRAKALYFAAKSCDSWRGQDHVAMSRRLRGYLRRDFGDSSWAKRN